MGSTSGAPHRQQLHGAEQLPGIRAPPVVFERQKNQNQGRAEPLWNSRVGGAGELTWAFGGIGTIHGKPTPYPDMTAARRFSGPVLEELAKAKILGVRAGTEHRYPGVWVVVG